MADALRAFVTGTGTDADWAGAILVSDFLHEQSVLKGRVEDAIKAMGKRRGKRRR